MKWRQDPIRDCSILTWMTIFHTAHRMSRWGIYISAQNKKMAPTKKVDAKVSMTDTKILSIVYVMGAKKSRKTAVCGLLSEHYQYIKLRSI